MIRPWISPMPQKCKENGSAGDSNSNRGKGPCIWLLLDDRPGHITQVLGLAKQLKQPFISHQLDFNFWNRLPNPLLGASLLGLRKRDRTKLSPPFPQLVIGMGRRIVPVARWIRHHSGGRTRIVLLGRKAVGDPDGVDLVVGCVHFGHMPHRRLFELVVPPTQVDAESLAQARTARPDPMAAFPKPRVVFLVGGPTAQHRFDARSAGQMASQVAQAIAKTGGSLAIVTSRRTPSEAVVAMQAAAPSAHMHLWQRERSDNPYLSYLAYADFLVVTGESESMLAEASATALPLTIFPLESKPLGLKHRLAKMLRRAAEGNGILSKLCRRILLSGWIIPSRDLAVMHRAMQERGLAEVFDGSLNTRRPNSFDEVEQLAKRVFALEGSSV